MAGSLWNVSPPESGRPPHFRSDQLHRRTDEPSAVMVKSASAPNAAIAAIRKTDLIFIPTTPA